MAYLGDCSSGKGIGKIVIRVFVEVPFRHSPAETKENSGKTSTASLKSAFLLITDPKTAKLQTGRMITH